MQPVTDPAISAAFVLLRDVLRDLRSRGRRTLIQGVKPNMQRTSLGGFDERRLGFATFTEFVEAARDADVVTLQKTPEGVELRLPAEIEVQERNPPRVPASRVGSRVRGDLWAAFVDWRPGLRRVFDKSSLSARVLPAEESPNETEDVRQLRMDLLAESGRFLEIEPIAFAEQQQWMETFVAANGSDPLAAALEAALTTDRPFQAFSRIVRTDPRLASAWNNHRTSQVAERVAAWLNQHGLAVNVWEPRPTGEATQRHTAAASGASPVPVSADDLRRALHRAIDRMPRTELLRLAVPLEYLISPDA